MALEALIELMKKGGKPLLKLLFGNVTDCTEASGEVLPEAEQNRHGNVLNLTPLTNTM